MFKGCNLIMFTAEGFSPYAVSPELTPTLYKMINEGFVFRNFYTPVWWVSTSDGEYVACTGLIPKGGVWSMARSGSNYMPFVMGNQFRNLGYLTKLTTTTHTPITRGTYPIPTWGMITRSRNGLEVKKTGESDLEMIEVTVDEYIDTAVPCILHDSERTHELQLLREPDVRKTGSMWMIFRIPMLQRRTSPATWNWNSR